MLESFATIKVLADELDFWEHAQANRSVDGDLAQSVCTALEPLQEILKSLETSSWPQALDFVDQARESLDGLWRAEGRNGSLQLVVSPE